jgi:hypothetical protein
MFLFSSSLNLKYDSLGLQNSKIKHSYTCSKKVKFTSYIRSDLCIQWVHPTSKKYAFSVRSRCKLRFQVSLLDVILYFHTGT